MSLFSHTAKRDILTHRPRSTDERYEEDRTERKVGKKHKDKSRRGDKDEFSDDGLEDWERSEPRVPRMLEAGPGSSAGASSIGGVPQSVFGGSGAGSGDADFIRENQRRRDRDGEGRETMPGGYNMSGGLGRREDGGY